jgi:hypothetical protein
LHWRLAEFDFILGVPMNCGNRALICSNVTSGQGPI